MEPELRNNAGKVDWPDQDIVFIDRDPVVMNAEQELAKLAPVFMKDAARLVDQLAVACYKIRNAILDRDINIDKQVDFLRDETGHLKDVCQSYGFSLAGQVSALLHQALASPFELNEDNLQNIENRLMILRATLK